MPVDAELIQLWQRIEANLEAALIGSSNLLTNDQIDEVREFLLHNEFGLSYESLVHALNEKGESPPPEVIESILKAAMLMNLDNSLITF